MLWGRTCQGITNGAPLLWKLQRGRRRPWLLHQELAAYSESASQKTFAAIQHFSDSVEGTLQKNLFTLISEYLEWIKGKQKAGIFAKLTIVFNPFQSMYISWTSFERPSLS